ERKGGGIGCDGQIVAAIVLQHQTARRETRDRPTDGERTGAASDADASYIGIDVDPRAMTDRTRQARRLGESGDAVSTPRCNGSREFEGRGVRNHGEVVGAIVLQYQSAGVKSRDGARNGVSDGVAGDADIVDRSVDVGSGAVADGAGEPCRLRRDGDVIVAARSEQTDELK